MDDRPIKADPDYRWEDVEIGRRELSGTHVVSEAEILDFARRFDPLPLHVDKIAAAAGPYGVLTASGSHMIAIRQRLLYDFPYSGAVVVSMGFEELRYVAPLRAGQACSVEILFDGKRPSRSRPQCGIATIGTVLRADGETVLSLRETVLMRRRGV